MNRSGAPTDEMLFRLQCIAVRLGRAPILLLELDISAPNVEEAVKQAREGIWPGEASGWRLVDLDGVEIASVIGAGGQ